MRSEAGNDFVDHLVGSSLDFRHGLILDWMRHVNCIEVRPSQSGGLRARRKLKFMSGHRHRGNAAIFEPDGVVQTARCARPSIGEAFHHRISFP